MLVGERPLVTRQVGEIESSDEIASGEGRRAWDQTTRCGQQSNEAFRCDACGTEG